MEEQLKSKIQAICAKMQGMKAKLKPHEIRDYHFVASVEPEDIVYTETKNYQVCVASWSETHYDDDIEGCFLNNTQLRVSIYSQKKNCKEIREQQLKRIITNSFVGGHSDPGSKYTRIKILPGQGDNIKVALLSEECLEDFLAGPIFEIKLD